MVAGGGSGLTGSVTAKSEHREAWPGQGTRTRQAQRPEGGINYGQLCWVAAGRAPVEVPFWKLLFPQ